MKKIHPWCIAHRGARDEAPENTLTALRKALAYPVDGIEFDVQLSADGVPVLFHDRILRKVGGGNMRVSDLKTAELEKMDWGRWFHPDFTGEPLPTLEGALNLLERCPRMMIEIKTLPGDHDRGHAQRLTETVINIINRLDIKPYHDRIMILSFDQKVLWMAHQMAPRLRYVLNLPKNDPAGALNNTGHLEAVDLKISKLTTPLADRIRSQGLGLFTYTCNGPRQVNKAIKLGVDAIITDRPRWLIDYLSLKYGQQQS